MSKKIADLASALGLDSKELREKISEMGIEVSPRARVLEDEVYDNVYRALLKSTNTADSQNSTQVSVENTESDESLIDEELGSEPSEDAEVTEIYDEIISQQREREIVKSQRKRMAGKDQKKKAEKEAEKKAMEAARNSVIDIGDSISVKEFSEKTAITPAKIIGELMRNGILANINQQIDFETASIIAEDLGIKVKRIRSAAGIDVLMSGDIAELLKEDDQSELITRPPVVCIMGHVDHGKTKLLDYIRQTNVVDKEAGGITQHIAAYQINHEGKLITFLDTPGHEAFTSMRARGAKVTDVAVLVVAADEGVKPQTIEAYNHAKEANVPVIVAISKVDKPNINIERVKGELTEIGLQPEDWGGSTITVPVSAMTGQGIKDLLEMILIATELENLRANPNREAVGTVIESHLDKSLGPVATILVNTGTLKVMDNVVIGHTYGRIKLLKNHLGQAISSAGPSVPVLIAGLNATPKSGDILQVVHDERTARNSAEQIAGIEKVNSQARMVGMNQILSKIQSEKILKLIIKGDAKGSIEAIIQSLAGIKSEEVAVKVIHSGVGAVTESDVMIASASQAMVLAFHSDFQSANVKKLAEHEGVEVKRYKVIYDLLEDVKRVLSGFLEPEILKIVLGRAEVKQVFLVKKRDMIVGVRVLSGKITEKSKVNIIRGRTHLDEDNVVGKGYLESIRKVDQIVKEMSEGNECGVKFVGDTLLKDGDILESFVEETKQRHL